MKLATATATVLAAALAVSSSHAAPPRRDLVEIDRGQDYRGVTYVVSVDRASRKPVPEGIFVIQYNVPEKAMEDGAAQTVTEYVVDCAMPQYKTTRKYRADAAGRVLLEEPIDRLTGGWRYGKQPGMSQNLVDAACTG